MGQKREEERLQLIRDIEVFFEKADMDGTGVISLPQLEKVLCDPDMAPVIKKLRLPVTWTAQELFDYLLHSQLTSVTDVGETGVTAESLVDACSRWHGDHERALKRILIKRELGGVS